MTKESLQHGLPRASVSETLAVMNDVMLPSVAKGVIIRRPRIVGLAERMKLDQRAILRVQRLEAKYGPGPLMLRSPDSKPMALVLDPGHANRILEQTPEPFATAEWAKRSVLAHFEPHMSLISHGVERAERRRFNDDVLQSHCAVHHLGDRFATVVQEEAGELLQDIRQAGGHLDWDAFVDAWNRVVRRVVLGDTARDDRALTETLSKLRAVANWGFLHPGREHLRKDLHERLLRYLERAEKGSLAAEVARTSCNEVTQPVHQVPQWLTAFNPAGMATFRALALLAAHPGESERAQAEIAHDIPHASPRFGFLRASILESLRLWPTVPLVLRESTVATQWENGWMPANTSMLLHAPFFHRDDRYLDDAHRFHPDLWLQPEQMEQRVLMPFSEGTGICPGRHLVLLVGSHMLARLLEGREYRLKPPTRLLSSKPMPPLLNNYDLTFESRLH
ncbi:MAG: cytochrome P450 [Halomonas sp.]|nr:cytochrome P450 [Halomonas sp.]MDX5504030.1 cytochrome P450 [Halomonas sp.]